MLDRALIAALTLVGGAFASAVPASAPRLAGQRDSHSAAVGRTPASAATTRSVSAAKLLGQRIMVGMQGTQPDAGLLRSVREGRVGSVILFSANISNRAQLRSLTASLQRAAHAGGNPPLLIATDQEGGQVKRLANGPPDLSPPQIVASGGTSLAFSEGRATGRYLKGLGINWDLAPVTDVPTFPGAFIWRQGRAFSFNADTVARYATAFALGLQNANAAATAKHFPGVGSAAVDTDNKLNELRPSRLQREAALKPYRALIPRGLDTVMLSTAGFPAYDGTGTPTALSRTIVQGLLRRGLGFTGVTITDALGTPTGHDEVTAGVLAARAGSDILLYTDSAPGELAALQRALGAGTLSAAEARASYQRIVALKRHVASG
jgi:beta-N-acetylhexosaminidase